MIKKRSQAWLKIARELDRLGEKESPYTGLCSMVANLEESGKISYQMRIKMLNDVHGQENSGFLDRFAIDPEDVPKFGILHNLAGTSRFMFPLHESPRRAMMARLFAYAAKDEGD